MKSRQGRRPARFDALPYVLLSPAVLATLALVFFPMLQAVVTSLYHQILWKPRDVRFIGLDNYAKMLSGRDNIWVESVKVTFVYSFSRVPLVQIIAQSGSPSPAARL